MSLPPYRKIDQSTWSRQDHYNLVYVKCCEPLAIYEDDDG